MTESSQVVEIAERFFFWLNARIHSWQMHDDEGRQIGWLGDLRPNSRERQGCAESGYSRERGLTGGFDHWRISTILVLV